MEFKEVAATASDWINQRLGLTDPFYGELIVSTALFILFIILGWIVAHIFQHYFQTQKQSPK